MYGFDHMGNCLKCGVKVQVGLWMHDAEGLLVLAQQVHENWHERTRT